MSIFGRFAKRFSKNKTEISQVPIFHYCPTCASTYTYKCIVCGYIDSDSYKADAVGGLTKDGFLAQTERLFEKKVSQEEVDKRFGGSFKRAFGVDPQLQGEYLEPIIPDNHGSDFVTREIHKLDKENIIHVAVPKEKSKEEVLSFLSFHGFKTQENFIRISTTKDKGYAERIPKTQYC